MGLLEVLMSAMWEHDPNLFIGVEIIKKMGDIYDDDFGVKLSEAPHGNYPKILSHLEEVEKLLKKEEK